MEHTASVWRRALVGDKWVAGYYFRGAAKLSCSGVGGWTRTIGSFRCGGRVSNCCSGVPYLPPFNLAFLIWRSSELLLSGITNYGNFSWVLSTVSSSYDCVLGCSCLGGNLRTFFDRWPYFISCFICWRLITASLNSMLSKLGLSYVAYSYLSCLRV